MKKRLQFGTVFLLMTNFPKPLTPLSQPVELFRLDIGGFV